MVSWLHAQGRRIGNVDEIRLAPLVGQIAIHGFNLVLGADEPRRRDSEFDKRKHPFFPCFPEIGVMLAGFAYARNVLWRFHFGGLFLDETWASFIFR